MSAVDFPCEAMVRELTLAARLLSSALDPGANALQQMRVARVAPGADESSARQIARMRA
jgi:hypothetical protein